METGTENERKSRSQKSAKMTREEMKKAGLDVFSEGGIDAARTWRTVGR